MLQVCRAVPFQEATSWQSKIVETLAMPISMPGATKQRPRMYDGEFRGKKAWTRDNIEKTDYQVKIPSDCHAEIRDAVGRLPPGAFRSIAAASAIIQLKDLSGRKCS